MNDHIFMEMALSLAEKGKGFTSPNPMVGAVVVKDGEVIGKGWHEAYGKAHAEVNAIDDAGKNAMGATIYVTLEPCNHTGKTPPCTEKILSAGIKRVVVAMDDPNPHVEGGGNSFLKKQGLDISTGILEDKAKKLNEVFIKYIQTKRPFVILKCASTLDGQIATRSGHSKWVTGPDSRAYVHELRNWVDGILVGINTIHKDNPSLTTRLEGREVRDPSRIILDSKLSIQENANVLQQDSESDSILISGILKDIDPLLIEKKQRLEKRGVRIIETPLKKGKIDLNVAMDHLGQAGITSLLIEGGGKVLASALSSGIVDKVNMFYAPKFLGGNDGVPVCFGPGPDKMGDCVQLTDVDVKRFGNDIMVEGYLKKNVPL